MRRMLASTQHRRLTGTQRRRLPRRDGDWFTMRKLLTQHQRDDVSFADTELSLAQSPSGNSMESSICMNDRFWSPRSYLSQPVSIGRTESCGSLPSLASTNMSGEMSDEEFKNAQRIITGRPDKAALAAHREKIKKEQEIIKEQQKRKEEQQKKREALKQKLAKQDERLSHRRAADPKAPSSPGRKRMAVKSGATPLKTRNLLKNRSGAPGAVPHKNAKTKVLTRQEERRKKELSRQKRKEESEKARARAMKEAEKKNSRDERCCSRKS